MGKAEEEIEIKEDVPEADFDMEEIQKVGNSVQPPSGKFYQRSENDPSAYKISKKAGKKKTLLLTVVLIIILVGVGVIFRHKINSFIKKVEPTPTPSAILAVTPTPTPNPLIRTDWSLEVQNGSGVTGEAKKVSDKLTTLGYPVVKSGNADKQTYQTTAVFVKKEFKDKIDLLVADLKDTIKIGTVAGELKEGTASARIIIGQDSTQ